MVGLILFLLLLIPTVAYSAPVIAAVATYAGWTTVAYFAGTALGTFLINTAAAMLLTKLTADNQSTPGREPQNRLHTIRSSADSHRIIYGEILTGGTLKYATSTGPTNGTLHLVIVLAGHEVESIGDVYLGEYLSTDARFQKNQKQISNIDFAFYVGDTASSSFAGTGTVIANGITFNQSQTINFASINADLNALRDGLYAQIIAHAGYAAAPYTASTSGIAMGRDARDLGRITLTAKVAGTGFTYSASASYAENAVTATAADGQPNANTSFVYIGKHLGTTTQAADATHIASNPQWNAARQLKGRAYIYVQLAWDQDIFPTGIPEIKCKVKGKKLYDPRTTTTYWSDNWALCARDYLASGYGMQCSAGEIDDASVITAANISDELVATTGAATQKRYRCNGSFTLDMAPKTIIEAIEKTACGLVTPVGGVYRIFAGAYTSPTVTLTDSDLRGPMKVRPTLPIDQVYNAVRGTYVDQVGNWQQTDFTAQKNATYAAEDGGEIYRDLELAMTTDGYQAQRVAKIYLERSRQAITVEFPANLKQAFGLALWDTVRITNSLLGWASKEFKVMKWSFKDGGVDLLLQEEASASYNWNNGIATVIDPAPNTNLPNPFAASPPINLMLTSGTTELLKTGDGSILSRIKGTFLAPSDTFVIKYEYQWRQSSLTAWSDSMTALSNTFYVDPVIDGASYDVRVRAVNSIGVTSPWVQVTNHVVIGKTEFPTTVPWSTIEGDVISWGEVADIDLAGYEVRMHYGINRSWGDANKLHTGLVLYSPLKLPSMPSGQVTIMIKAVDRSGNYSHDTPAIITQLGDTPVANILVTFNFATLGWPGTITGGANNAGVLEATASALMWSGNSAKNMWTTDGELMWQGGYSEMVYTDSIRVDTAIAGAAMTIPFNISGDIIKIEYRATGPNPMWSTQPLDPMWSIDDTKLMWSIPDYVSWPGSIITKPDTYDFRITIGFGATQGKITQFIPTIDVPDVIENIQNVSIISAGQRLVLTKTYSKIINVTPTLQGGGSAVTIKVIDKNFLLGPLVQGFDGTNTAAAASGDFLVQGY